MDMVQGLENALEVVVDRLTPAIQEERRALGLQYPEDIAVKAEIDSLQPFASHYSEEDFIRINFAQLFTNENGFSDESSARAQRLAEYVSRVSVIRNKHSPTLEETVLILEYPSDITHLTFNYLPEEESRQQHESIRDWVAGNVTTAQENLEVIIPLATEAVKAGKFDETILWYLRHETEHYVSPNKPVKKKLMDQYFRMVADLKVKELSELDWEEIQDFRYQLLQNKIENNAREEAMGLFFVYVPQGEWSEEAIDAAARTIKMDLDSYNPSVFLSEALNYFISMENAKRVKEGRRDLIHPEGDEFRHMMKETYPKAHELLPPINPQEVDMDFVRRSLYTELPKLQVLYSQIANDTIDGNQAHLKSAISKS